MAGIEVKRWTDTDLRTAFEDGCKFTSLSDLIDFLEKRNEPSRSVEDDLNKSEIAELGYARTALNKINPTLF